MNTSYKLTLRPLASHKYAKPSQIMPHSPLIRRGICRARRSLTSAPEAPLPSKCGGPYRFTATTLMTIQSTLGTVFATGGPLAEDDYEGTVHDFLLWLARQDAVQGMA